MRVIIPGFAQYAAFKSRRSLSIALQSLRFSHLRVGTRRIAALMINKKSQMRIKRKLQSRFDESNDNSTTSQGQVRTWCEASLRFSLTVSQRVKELQE